MPNKLIQLLFFLLVFTGTLFAQKENYNASIDAKTYQLALVSDWENLREIGFNAIEAGIDFFYLRLRLGISYYEEQDYMSSIPQFEKALSFRNKDTLALEYLYYAYLFSGLKTDAIELAEKFPPSLRQKTGFKNPDFLSGLYAEGSYTFVPGIDDTKNKKKTNSLSAPINYKLTEKETYLNFSLLHSLGSRVTYFHGISSVIVNSLVINEGYSRPVQDASVSTKQLEYYGNLTIKPLKRLTLFAAIHYLGVKIQDAVLPDPNNPPPAPDTYTTNYKEMVYTGGISGRIGKIEPGISVLYSNLNNGYQHQENIIFAWYPLGNLNFYTVSNLVFHSNKEKSSSAYVTHFILDQKIGFKLSGKIWGEGVITAGKMMNYSESNGFVVYNVVDDMNYKLGVNFLFLISKNIEFSFRYLFVNSLYKVYQVGTLPVQYQTENLNKHKIIGGFKWTF